MASLIIGMDAGAALLSLRRDLDPGSAPTLEELRSALAQVERGGDSGCWLWRGPNRTRFRDRQWNPRRLLYHWFGGTLRSNQRLAQTCAPPPPKRKRDEEQRQPTLVQVLESEDNVFEIRVVQELLVYPKKERRRKQFISRCVNPGHQLARQALPGESTDDSMTGSSSSSSSSSAYGSDVTIETVAPHRSAREVCQAAGISLRKYRKLTAPDDKPGDG